MKPLRKPGTKRKPGRIKRVSKATGELQVICRSNAAWQAQRESLHARAMGFCEKCGRWCPLHGNGAGHAHHTRGRGMGGGKRNDALEGLAWFCPPCHLGEHKQITAQELMAQKRDVAMYLNDEDFPGNEEGF